MAFIDDFNHLRFDLNKPKQGQTQRAICYDFSKLIQAVASDPVSGVLCGVSIWNTRTVNLRDLTNGQEVPDGLSRFIFGTGTGVQYKVRYAPFETVCPGLVQIEGTGVAITGGPDDNSDGKSDSWTIDATDRVAFVTRANSKGKDQAWQCVGTYQMSWVATLTRTDLN